jgi:MarR family transcriptional regulator, organic hydroperoxide resistance regulator
VTSFDTSYDTPEASPGFLLWKVANLHQRLQRRALSGLDLTPTQFSVLACFAELSKGGAPSQADVCVLGALDKMIVSDATRALVTKGFLSKTPSTTDRRAATVKLTRTGRTACNRAVTIVEALDASLFDPTRDAQPLVAHLQAILAANEVDH